MELKTAEIKKIQTFLRTRYGTGNPVSGEVCAQTQNAYAFFLQQLGVRFPDCNIFPSTRAELPKELQEYFKEGTVDITSDQVPGTGNGGDGDPDEVNGGEGEEDDLDLDLELDEALGGGELEGDDDTPPPAAGGEEDSVKK